MKNRWFAFRSEQAIQQGCPVFTYRDKFGKYHECTGVTETNYGGGYDWPDKTFVVEVTHMRGIRSSYIPHADLYRL